MLQARFMRFLLSRIFFPWNGYQNIVTTGRNLGGHVTAHKVPGVTLSTGSLGHGMPYGLGVAIGLKKTSPRSRVFVLMSDGECNEGTTWESALLASHHQVDNLVVVIDRNRLQSLATTEDTLALEPFAEKWEKFGWEVRTIDGHFHEEIWQSLKRTNRPLCVVANTIKGKGVNFMENSIAWHYKSPNTEELASAISQVTGGGF
jgi:transketolase